MNIQDTEINNLVVLADAVELATAVIFETSALSLGLGENTPGGLADQGTDGIRSLVLARIRNRNVNATGV